MVATNADKNLGVLILSSRLASGLTNKAKKTPNMRVIKKDDPKENKANMARTKKRILFIFLSFSIAC